MQLPGFYRWNFSVWRFDLMQLLWDQWPDQHDINDQAIMVDSLESAFVNLNYI